MTCRAELSADVIADRLRRAADRRADLGLASYRMFHGYGEGIGGLSIDRYGEAAVIRHRRDHEPWLATVAAEIARDSSIRLITARRRGFGEPPAALLGELPADRAPVTVGELTLLLSFARAGNPGLYLDARPARDWLRQNSSGRRVLNLFAFTGSLGITAAVAGARSVTHVDSHGPTLAWARANCELNDLRTDDRDFARINVYQHLRRNQSGRQRYGGIIIDPPPSSPEPGGKDRTPGLRGVAAIAPQASRMLEPGGWMLCFFHHDRRPIAELEEEVLSAGELEVGWRGTSGEDFPEIDENARLRLTAFFRS